MDFFPKTGNFCRFSEERSSEAAWEVGAVTHLRVNDPEKTGARSAWAHGSAKTHRLSQSFLIMPFLNVCIKKLKIIVYMIIRLMRLW